MKNWRFLSWLALGSFGAACALAAALPGGAAQAPGAGPSAVPPWSAQPLPPNLVPNPEVRGTSGWGTLLKGAAFDPTVSRRPGSGSIKLSPPGAQVQSGFLPVRPGTTYTFSVFLKTTAWPALGQTQLGVYDQNRRFKFNWKGSYQATSAPGVWQETVTCYTAQPGDAFVKLNFLRMPQGRSPRNDGDLWIDDFYFGEGIRFRQPPAPKTPFSGSHVRVDELGNFEVRRGNTWEPFFPFGVFQDSRRKSYAVYSAQGFNCIMNNNFSFNYLALARQAVSKFNPHGMMSMIELSPYTDPRVKKWYRDVASLRQNLAKLESSPLLDSVLAFYWDNEQYADFAVAKQVTGLVQNLDRDPGGGRRHPIYMLQANEGMTRVYNGMADVTGNYLRDMETVPHLGPMETTRQRWAVAQNLEQQRIPSAIGILSEEERAEGVRRLVYEGLITGVRGIAYFRDGASYQYNGDKNSPAAKDMTLRRSWAEFPRLRAEIDRLLPVLRQPAWTTWKASASAVALRFGTRTYNGEGNLIVLNPTAQEVPARFTLEKLDYAPAGVRDYFSGAAVAPVQGGSFEVSLRGHGTAVYRLARP